MTTYGVMDLNVNLMIVANRNVYQHINGAPVDFIFESFVVGTVLLPAATVVRV